MPPRKGKEKEKNEEPSPDVLLTFNETVQFVVEFLEVAFNTILYLRQVYPNYAFTKVKKYETPVWKARVPMLQTYLADAAKAAGEQISQGAVKQVLLSIRSVRTQRNLETFVFDFDYLGVNKMFFASLRDRDTKIEGSPTRGQLAMILRGLLTKLNVTDGIFSGCAEEECTFDIGIQMKDDVDMDPTMPQRSKGKPPLWIPGQTDVDKMVSIPMRTANMGVLNMQMFVQENTSKSSVAQETMFRSVDKGKGRA